MPDRPPNPIAPTWGSIRPSASIRRQWAAVPMILVVNGTAVRVGLPPIPVVAIVIAPPEFAGTPKNRAYRVPRFMRRGKA